MDKDTPGLDNDSINYLLLHLQEITAFSEDYTFTDDLVVAYIFIGFIIIGLPANLIEKGFRPLDKAL